MAECAYVSNASTAAEIADHLRGCDRDFSPPLGSRVDIAKYAEKLFDRAVRFEARDKGGLVGLVAVYCNPQVSPAAFITNVSVLPEWRGRRIANRLLSDALCHMKDAGIRRVELEVAPESVAAYTLYSRLGFAEVKRTDESIFMQLDLL